jgi:hypothetical protein
VARRELHGLLSGVRTHFFGHDRRTRHVLFEAFGNYDPEAIRSYMDYWQTNPSSPDRGKTHRPRLPVAD